MKTVIYSINNHTGLKCLRNVLYDVNEDAMLNDALREWLCENTDAAIPEMVSANYGFSHRGDTYYAAYVFNIAFNKQTPVREREVEEYLGKMLENVCETTSVMVQTTCDMLRDRDSKIDYTYWYSRTFRDMESIILGYARMMDEITGKNKKGYVSKIRKALGYTYE